MMKKPARIDILFGRDSDSWNHEGNRNFRELVVKHQEKYHVTQARSDKVSIVANIVSELKASGAKFLKRDNDSKMWFEVDRKACIEKVGHAIRDKQVIAQRRLQKRRSLFESSKGALLMNPLLCGGSSLTDLTTHGAMHLQNSIVQDVLAAQRFLVGRRQELSDFQSTAVAAARTKLAHGEIMANGFVDTESLIVASLQEQKVAQQLKAIEHCHAFLANALSTQRRQSLTSTTGLAQLQQVQRRLSLTTQFPILVTSSSSLLDTALRMPIDQSTSSMPLHRTIDGMSLKNIAPSFLRCYK